MPNQKPIERKFPISEVTRIAEREIHAKAQHHLTCVGSTCVGGTIAGLLPRYVGCHADPPDGRWTSRRMPIPLCATSGDHWLLRSALRPRIQREQETHPSPHSRIPL